MEDLIVTIIATHYELFQYLNATADCKRIGSDADYQVHVTYLFNTYGNTTSLEVVYDMFRVLLNQSTKQYERGLKAINGASENIKAQNMVFIHEICTKVFDNYEPDKVNKILFESSIGNTITRTTDRLLTPEYVEVFYALNKFSLLPKERRFLQQYTSHLTAFMIYYLMGSGYLHNNIQFVCKYAEIFEEYINFENVLIYQIINALKQGVKHDAEGRLNGKIYNGVYFEPDSKQLSQLYSSDNKEFIQKHYPTSITALYTRMDALGISDNLVYQSLRN